MEKFSPSTSWLRLSTGDEFPETAHPRPKRLSRRRRDESESPLQGQSSYRNFSWKISSPNLPGSLGARDPPDNERALDRTEIEQQNNNHVVENQPCHENLPNSPTPRPIKSVWMPFLVVLIPNLAIPGVLLALVDAHKFRPKSDLFRLNMDSVPQHPGYILVNLSATRLAIITSCASTLAPFLTASIMSLWKFRAIRNIQQRTVLGEVGRDEISQIPLVSLLISLLAGSLEGFFKYVRKCCPGCLSRWRSQTTTPMPRSVHSAGLILCCCIFLAISMWAADTVFHTLSEAVSVPEITISTSINSFGHQLIDSCLLFNRSENSCLPCTRDQNGNGLEYWERKNSVYKLRTNISEVSQVQSIDSDLSILLPYSSRVPNNTDYRATTLGVSIGCRPVTDTCQPRYLNEISDRTVFNCTDEFRGVIGEAPMMPLNASFTILDPDTPPLSFKTSAYLQFGFYRDADLSVTYNPVNYNVSELGWAKLYGDSSKTPCPTDNALLSSAYMGVAGRFSLYYTKAGNNLTNDRGLFTATTFMDFMFSCSVEAFEVDYVWAHGGVRSHTLKPANGSVLNMYIGSLQHSSSAPTDDAVSLINQMALEDNSTAMANTWAKLFTTRVLSVIGGYTSGSQNQAEQTRKDILVARVHIGGLVFITGCGAAYAILVSVVAISAFTSVQKDPRLYGYVQELSFEAQLKRKMQAEQEASRTGSEDTRTSMELRNINTRMAKKLIMDNRHGTVYLGLV